MAVTMIRPPAWNYWLPVQQVQLCLWFGGIEGWKTAAVGQMSGGSYWEGGEHDSADDVQLQRLQRLVNVLQYEHSVFSPFSCMDIKLTTSGCTSWIRVCWKGLESMGEKIMVAYLGCEIEDPVSRLIEADVSLEKIN